MCSSSGGQNCIIQHLVEDYDNKRTWSVPKVMRMIFLHSAVGPGKDSGSRGRWRGNPGIQFDHRLSS